MVPPGPPGRRALMKTLRTAELAGSVPGPARAPHGAPRRFGAGGFYKAAWEVQVGKRGLYPALDGAPGVSTPARCRRAERLATTAISSLGSAGFERYIWNPAARILTRSSILA